MHIDLLYVKQGKYYLIASLISMKNQSFYNFSKKKEYYKKIVFKEYSNKLDFPVFESSYNFFFLEKKLILLSRNP